MLLPKDYVRLPPDRRVRQRSLRRLGHGAVRCRAPALVARTWWTGWGSTASILPRCLRIERRHRRHYRKRRPRRPAWRRERRWCGGGGDQAASAVGNGIVEPGIVSCTIGTSGVVFAHMEQVAYDPAGRVHTFCHAVRGKWHVMGVTQGAGLSLQWFRNQLAPGVELRRSDRGSRAGARRLAGPVLASLSDGRAHAASGCDGARRLDRHDRQAHARRPDPRR